MAEFEQRKAQQAAERKEHAEVAAAAAKRHKETLALIEKYRLFDKSIFPFINNFSDSPVHT